MKTAIIIGATSGIGREVAARLVRQGWKVGITGRRAEALAAFQEEFGKDAVFTRRMDITAADAPELLDALLAETGAPDLFLHVSGIGFQNLGLDEKTELDTVSTNCSGMVRMVSHFVNYVKSSGAYSKERKARIGVVTSVAGTAGLGIAPAYSASKKMQSTYLSALSQQARMEKLPIAFSDIRPGFVATAILNPDMHYPMMISVEKAAGYILRGLSKGRRLIIFDGRFRLLTGLWRCIPRGIWERMTFLRVRGSRP